MGIARTAVVDARQRQALLREANGLLELGKPLIGPGQVEQGLV
jgi:hypothetical protein